MPHHRTHASAGTAIMATDGLDKHNKILALPLLLSSLPPPRLTSKAAADLLRIATTLPVILAACNHWLQRVAAKASNSEKRALWLASDLLLHIPMPPRLALTTIAHHLPPTGTAGIRRILLVSMPYRTATVSQIHLIHICTDKALERMALEMVQQQLVLVLETCINQVQSVA